MIIILFLLSISQAQTTAVDTSERNHVAYEKMIENYTRTILEGIVIDSETREKIENADLVGEAHSEVVPLSMTTDESGHFRTVLPNSLEPGLHDFFLDTSATAYDERRVTGTIRVDEAENIIIELNYHPFDLILSEESGQMNRNWKENKHEETVTENFTDTRKVIDHYETEPEYVISEASPFYSVWDAINELKYESRRTVEKLESRNEDWWFRYCSRKGRINNTDMEPNSQQDFEYGFQHYQGFNDWRNHRIFNKNSGRYYTVQVPHLYQFLKETGKYKKPVYRTEKYTRWRTTTYEITNHTLDNWKNKQITIRTIPRNNYENKIILQTNSEKNLQTKTGKNTLNPHSTTQTTLTMNPSNKTRETTHKIPIKTYDSNGRQVQTKQYQLDLNTPPKPPKENKKINEKVTDKKPDKNENDKTGEEKKYIGVTGTLKDSKTGEKLHHTNDTAEVHVERNDFNGTANWPITTEYEHSLYTYMDLSWTMNLTADANNHRQKSATVSDSTSEPGKANKNFNLERKSEY